MQKPKYVLGIESTCDETGAAVVQNGKIILSNIIASSADIHRKYGGVFPELACRRHIEAIIPVVDEALQTAGVSPDQIDLIAVAKGPGLIGALLIGMNAAKGLSIAWKKPLIGVNHVEAHLYASMMDVERVPLPALGLVLSGGHTLMLKILEIGAYEPIGTTVDDAIGEAFDKVGNLLGLPYPGGPEVEKLARLGNPKAFPLSAGKVKRSPLNFSFSGLKTAVLYAMKGNVDKAGIAASFQETALRDVAHKALLASQTFDCQSIILGGGVTANQRLKEIMKETFPHLPIFWPPGTLSLDNAAMIAGLGAHKFTGLSDPLDLEAKTRILIV
ncbi:MAG: tRNA (adenosine(37)-N6)-threonylcarbamoyltransferase complex transferase subunit TsaD [Verrucomicrobia bacterium]|nr:tRNA (adenosine(37)-N6)-threonylcarbamoyltransferase complex transferase subunit TsaD [Verrucomicrobiota bacterium]MBU6445773.1 tRNA (adenosine(37)-N6)-threonylcarbamoyltransferase complex transferase subunit TsaD [Verrucomicrobiota bacterium]MDE3046810.1 tRNA (adenosine(37)-N6)-threonylcarbamoyltransferase complex transferase subunit TsaD [Verrucomicrobiota bacterium]